MNCRCVYVFKNIPQKQAIQNPQSEPTKKTRVVTTFAVTEHVCGRKRTFNPGVLFYVYCIIVILVISIGRVRASEIRGPD